MLSKKVNKKYKRRTDENSQVNVQKCFHLSNLFKFCIHKILTFDRFPFDSTFMTFDNRNRFDVYLIFNKLLTFHVSVDMLCIIF